MSTIATMDIPAKATVKASVFTLWRLHGLIALVQITRLTGWFDLLSGYAEKAEQEHTDHAAADHNPDWIWFPFSQNNKRCEKEKNTDPTDVRERGGKRAARKRGVYQNGKPC